MKKHIRYTSFVLCLLSFFMSGPLSATHENTFSLEFTKEFSNSASDLLCGTPTWPNTYNITQTSATFSWSSVAGAESYTVQTRLPNGTWYDLPTGPVYGSFVTINGLSPNTSYQWRVRANCGGGETSSWTNAINFTTEGGGYCLAPDWLGTTNITQTTATFDWSSANGAQSYSIQWRFAGGTWYNLNGGPFYNTWVNIGNLDPATNYEWRVKSNCSYGSMSDWSYPASFTTLGNYCNTPTWPSTSNIGANSATFNWSGSSGAQSYSVQLRLPNGSWSDVYGSPTSNTWINVNNLQSGTTYEWRVRANCGNGQYSNWTYPATFTTSGGYSCYAPEWLDAVNIGQTTATLDWEAVSGAQSYSIQWRISGGTWYNLNGGPFYNTWVNIGNLDPGTTYEWRVRSNCANGAYSPWSYADSFTTLGYSCSTPGWPSTSNITSSGATFNWSAVAGAANYSVQIRYPNGTWTYLSGSPFNNTWITVTNLSPNTTYEWRVRANCSGSSYSDWTYPTTFTTTGGYSCHAPDWLGTTNITSTSALLDWSSEPGAQSYSLEYRIAGGTWYSVSGGPFYETWHTLTGLQPGTTYEWRVRSNCGGGAYSNWSYYASFTTLGYTCSTPTWPSTSNITATSASFSWSAVSGAQDYSVELRLPNGTWSPVYGSPFNNNYASVNNLSPGTTYEWRVRANCGNGQYSNWTYPTTFTTLAGYQCASPNWLGTSNITSTSAVLDWSPVTGAQSYTAQYRIVGGTWYDVPGNPFTDSWATLTGLQPSTSYEWRVRSNCSNGATSDWSYSGTFTTLGYQCNTPGWPSTSNITSTGATFNWTSSSGAQSYTVEIRYPNGSWSEISGNPFSGTSASVNNLTPNTTYEWRVRANCSNGQHSNWTYPTSFTTSGGITCYAPDWLGTSNITQTSALLDWSNVNGAESYSVQYRLSGGTWYNVSGGPFTESSYTLSGLQPGTHYEWRVRSNCPNGMYSNWSYYASFYTQGYACGTPTWPSTSNITSSSASFSWSAVGGADSYTVQIRLVNGTWQDIAGGPVYGTSATVNNLLSNTTYEWRVRANCSGQYSNWTSGIYFTTGGSGYCHAPEWLYTANITATTATFDWDPVNGAINYSVQWRFAGGTWQDLNGGPFSSTWVNVGNLQPGTTYEWRVRSNCSNWSTSPWSYPAIFTTQGYSCGIPTWPSTSNITSHSAELSWTGVSGANSYTVQIRSSNGYWQNVSGGPFNNTWVNVSGLYPNTTYEWRVRANCGYNQYSDWTYPVSFTTSGGSYCTAPNWLYTSNITQNSATLDWNTVNEAVSYTVQWRLAGTQSWFTLMEGPFYNSYFHATNLTPGTSYEWRVRSNCYGGNYSAWSYTANFTTQGYYCSTPTWPSTYSITQTTATVSWSAVSGAQSYTVQIRWPSGTWTNVTGSPFYNTSVTITGLTPGTTYEWRVRSNCSGGQYSNWTSHISFTTINSLVDDLPDLFIGDETTIVVPDAEDEIESDKVSDGFVTPSELDLRVSPNPANEFINIALLQTDDCRVAGVSLVDLSGKRVFTKSYEASADEEFTDRIDVNQLQPGMYVVQIATACGVLTEKIVVTR